MERVLSQTTGLFFGRAPATATLWRRLCLWADLWGERRALSRLDPHILRDIGIAAEEADREARRPCWDAPAARLLDD
jgi:uncharacterized protein YjiS (DUF1127 family)